MTTSTLTPRQTFRETVALVAAKAREKLPEAVNGRIENAVKLVLAYDVTPQADGTIVVGSSSDPIKTYRLVGTTCECQDFTRGQAPGGFCQHRIAAGIAKRVQELLPDAPAPEPEPQATGAATVASEPLYESPASVNVHLEISGRMIQLTLRGRDEWALLARLEEVLQRYPLAQPQAPAQPPHQGQGPREGWCAIHQTQMRWNEGKDGRKGWHSHKAPDGAWCQGRERR